MGQRACGHLLHPPVSPSPAGMCLPVRKIDELKQHAIEAQPGIKKRVSHHPTDQCRDRLNASIKDIGKHYEQLMHRSANSSCK